MRDKPKVGEILVAAGIIDEMQLASALGEQERWGKRLGVTLIKLGMVDESNLIRALATQLDLPVASLAGKRIAPEVIALVSAKIASQHGVIPLFTRREGRNDVLYLGMEEPSNLAVLDDVSFRTGLEVRPVMVGPSELGEAIDRYYYGRDHTAPQCDPFHGGDTIGAASLRVLRDDEEPAAMTQPTPSGAMQQEAPRSAQSAGAMLVAAAEIPPPKQPEPASAQPSSPPQHVASTAAESAPTPLAPTTERSPEPPSPQLELDIARAIEETERTRIVAKAITQLLIEKGVLELEEVQRQIAHLKDPASDESD